MCKFNMFITAVCVLFLIKLRWPKNKSIFREFAEISEDCRRRSRKTRRCFDDTPTNLSDKVDIGEIIDISTCEDIISSHVRISYRFYRFVTTRHTTDFYIRKKDIAYHKNTP